jgi:CRISPR/Cas system CMR subunit Cmr4 (Cas7 group RAMP superfamily)
MTTLDSLTKSFDNLLITTLQNILRTNIEICKWSFLFTSIGVGINLLLNSFYFLKISNENNILKTKINLLINEQKVVIEGNITIYEFIKKNNLFVEDKTASLLVNECENDNENDNKNQNDNDNEYDFLHCQ